MTLSEFLAKEKLTQAEFGRRFSPPVSQSLLSQWLKGAVQMTLPRAIECNRLTGHLVSIEECAAMFKAGEKDAA